MLRLALSVFIAIALVAITMLLAGPLHLGVKIIVLKLALWGLPVTVIAWIVARRFANSMIRTRTVLLSFGIFLALLVPVTFLGDALVQIRLDRAKVAGTEIAARLTVYKQQHGVYPASLDDLSASGAPVTLPPFAPEDFYVVSSDLSVYELILEDPTSVFDYWRYDLGTSVWLRID